MPRNVPPSLRATFEKNTEINYDVSSTNSPTRKFASAVSNKKSAFADSYLDRLGISGGRSPYSSSGTDFSSTRDTDWEEVRLRRQLTELESQYEKAEAAAARRKKNATQTADNSKVGLVRSQLEQLYDYKRRQLRKLRSGESVEDVSGMNLPSMKQEIEVLKQQVDMLEDYCNRKQTELNKLYSDIEKEKSS